MDGPQGGGGGGTSLTGNGHHRGVVPLPKTEVLAKPTRRKFSKAYKRSVVERANACKEAGEIGDLLRREGLYSSHLHQWRRAYRQGLLEKGVQGGAKSVRGRGARKRVRGAEGERELLRAEVRKLRLIVDIQAKLAELVGLSVGADDRR